MKWPSIFGADRITKDDYLNLVKSYYKTTTKKGYGNIEVSFNHEWAIDKDSGEFIFNLVINTSPDQTLEVGEVMQFSNHFYAEAVETDTKRGAFEFLIDPQTGVVVGEPGPNMMWNLRYGMNMMLGMGLWQSPVALGSEMPVAVEQAQEYAQAFLDEVLPGTQVDDEADAFYGYYTLHVNRDGETIGMLSVNGYTGQVFLHTWHGNLLEMSGES